MAASDYVPIFFKNRLHLAGRPQMGSLPRAQSQQQFEFGTASLSDLCIRAIRC